MKTRALAAVLFLVSCSAPVPCGPSTCTGCCDSSGLCQSLSTSAACGSNGAACVNCGTQTCSFGSCVGGFGQGGGFSGTGGGSSGTGGGAVSAGGSATAGGSASAGGTATSGGTATAGGAASAGGSAGGGFVSAGGSAQAGGAAPNAPDILLLVDISGSMNSPINPSEPTCGTCSGSMCPNTCPTRVSILRNALTSYLQPNATLARWGLTTFPSAATFTPSGCAPASTQTVPMLDPSTPTSTSTLTTQSAQVRNLASGLGIVTTIVGGTPTGPSLRFAATIPALSTSSTSRARGIVLITDGLPNCNPANPLSCSSQPPPPVDLCTLGPNCTASYCQAGYLDQTGTVQAVAALRLAGVKTAIVVIDNAPTAQVTSVMNAMADEGGATACSPTNPGCLQRFFPANDQTSLLTAVTSAVARVSVP